MSSRRHNVMSTPAETGVWSYKPVQLADEMSIASTTSYSMEVCAPIDKSYLSNYVQRNEPVIVAAPLPMKLLKSHLSPSEIKSKQSQMAKDALIK